MNSREPLLEINEVAYFVTNFVPFNYPFQVKRVVNPNGFYVTVPEIGNWEYKNTKSLYTDNECLIYQQFYEDWDELMLTVIECLKRSITQIDIFDPLIIGTKGRVINHQTIKP